MTAPASAPLYALAGDTWPGRDLSEVFASVRGPVTPFPRVLGHVMQPLNADQQTPYGISSVHDRRSLAAAAGGPCLSHA